MNPSSTAETSECVSKSTNASSSSSSAAISSPSKGPSLPSRGPALPLRNGAAAKAMTTPHPGSASSSTGAAAAHGATGAASAGSLALSSKPGSSGPSLPPRKVAFAADAQQPPQQASTSGASAGPSLPKRGTSSASAASSSASSANGGAMPSLPPRTTGSVGTASAGGGGGASGGVAAGPVLDPDEPPAIQDMRRVVHGVRVQMIRSAQRLGYDRQNPIVYQVLWRLCLAERCQAPWSGRGKRPDPVLAAAQEARKLEASQGPQAPLKYTVRILLVGLQGCGKTQLASSLLGSDVVPCDGTPTTHVHVLRGRAGGIELELLDTPGLQAAAAGTAHNAQALRQIRTAYKAHQPDIMLYVDRLDSRTNSYSHHSAVQGLCDVLGPGVWLNTILVFTHAGAAPPPGMAAGSGGSQGPAHAALSYEDWMEGRSHALQVVIRKASGDARLMNPVAFVECHPKCPKNAQGQCILRNGLAWQPHMLLMLVSAKLLADTEALLQQRAGAGQAADGGMGGQDPMALMASAKQMPLQYLLQQLTSNSHPVKYPGHSEVMNLRAMRYAAGRVPDAYTRREALRQAATRVVQMRALARRQRQQAEAYRRGSKSGGKLMPEPPRTATRSRPSAQPAQGFRYRAPEAQGGWVVRPHIEHHCADGNDGIEGFQAEKQGIATVASLRRVLKLSGVEKTRGSVSSSGTSPSTSASKSVNKPGTSKGMRSDSRDPPDGLTGGIPFRASLSAQCSKEQRLLSARGEASLWHGLRGLASTTLSTDVQTSGAPGSTDVLAVARADLRMRGPRTDNFGLSRGGVRPKLTVGTIVAKLGSQQALLQGPTAFGARAQSVLNATPLGAGGKLILSCATLHNRGPFSMDTAWGANAELRSNLGDLLNLTRSVPLSLGVAALGAVGGPSGTSSTAALQATAGLHYRPVGESSKSAIALQASATPSGATQLKLKVRTGRAPNWLGPLVMLWPLLAWARDMQQRASWEALKRCFISRAPGRGTGGNRRVRSSGSGVKTKAVAKTRASTSAQQ